MNVVNITQKQENESTYRRIVINWKLTFILIDLMNIHELTNDLLVNH